MNLRKLVFTEAQEKQKEIITSTVNNPQQSTVIVIVETITVKKSLKKLFSLLQIHNIN